VTELIEGRHCKDCGFCRYRKKFDYFYCLDRSDMEIFCVDPDEDGCTFGKDIGPDWEDEDRIYEQHREDIR